MHRRPLKILARHSQALALGLPVLSPVPWQNWHQFCHRKSDRHIISPSNHCQRGHFRCPGQKGSCSPPPGLLSLLCCFISQRKPLYTNRWFKQSMILGFTQFVMLLPSTLCWCCMAPVCPPKPAAEVLRTRWAGTGCAGGLHLGSLSIHPSGCFKATL